MSTKPHRPDHWWHWAILAAVFGASGVVWTVDPPVGGLGYVVALLMLALAANCTHTAWNLRRRHRALRDRGPDTERIP
jgi:hypothetical protein